MNEPNSTRTATPRNFKCPRCGWVHGGISLKDAQEQVLQAQAFYVFASKINGVTTRGPDAYLESYKRCYKCGTTAGDFVPALPGDVQEGCALQAVIAPNTPRRSSLLDSSEALHRIGALSDAEMRRLQAALAPRMNEYEFPLKYLLSSDDANPDEFLELLGAAGCTDALVGIGKPGGVALEFTRKRSRSGMPANQRLLTSSALYRRRYCLMTRSK